jgi:hypothetical protein
LRSHIAALFALIASAIVLIWRASPSWNTLRGDESLLLSDALESGLSASLQSFGGYMHLIQRLTLWTTSFFPPAMFPRVIFVFAIVFWLVNLALFGLVVHRLTKRTVLWLIVPAAAALPPLGIELMGDLVHIQIAMFVGIASLVVAGQLPRSTNLLHILGLYVFLFGLSSPSIALIAAWAFYRHEFPIVGSRDDERPNRVILRYSLAALFIQLWVTTVQDDRQIAFSFNNFLEGIRFMLHGLLPQPYRDYYFDVNTNDNLVINSVFLFGVLALLAMMLFHAKKVVHDGRPESRVAELVAFGTASTVFYTTISDDYHTGYVAALYVFALFGVVFGFLQLKGWRKAGYAVLLLVMAIGSAQSLTPKDNDDVYFGGSGWLYEELVPWNEALDAARRACTEIPDRNIFVATNKTDTYWGVVMKCEELE